jgi:HAE1 family hydrophobic/amphiphilic exporter-1
MEGVDITLYKEGDANTVQVAENVEKRLKEIEKDLPENYQLLQVYDQSQFISNAISQVQSAAMLGGLLAMCILFLFLRNIWPTLIISLSIPVSIIATFNLMFGNDISLNIMSLGGIALAIGLLVDNSIVVLENIDRHKQNNPDNVAQAAATGTKEVSMAITASTLTTMAVFFPLVFVEGIAGQLFRDQALTVTFALIVSLLVALTLIPMLAAREKSASEQPSLTIDSEKETRPPKTKVGKVFYWLGARIRWLLKAVFYYIPLGVTSLIILLARFFAKGAAKITTPLLKAFEAGYQALEKAYQRVLNSALNARVSVLIGILSLSALSTLLLPRLGLELIPSLSQGEFHVELNLPNGSHIDKTDEVLAELSAYTQKLDGVARTYTLAGTGSLMNASPAQGGDHWGKLNVVMTEDSSSAQQEKVKSKMRAYLSQQAGVLAKFGEPELFSFATPLEVEITGYNLDMLQFYGNKLTDLMATSSRFADIKSSLQAGNPELKIRFDHGKLAQLGLNAADVSRLIAAKIGGKVASKFSIEDRKVDILVRTRDTQRDSIEDIGQLIVNPGAELPTPLDAVAEINLSVGPSEITRIGQQRTVVVSANLAFGDLGEAVQETTELLKSLNLPLSMQANVAGQSEEMQASFDSLMFALALAIFLVYLVMASQFESLLHPLLILFTVPLACAGSIYGLFLSNTNVSVVVFIGLIMLAGIVVNNAIVLIDRINQLRADGTEKMLAIKTAAQNRLRPIMMTTLTTTLGLLPMMIGSGEGAEIRAPMAVTVIFGLSYASVLTLIFIPCLYAVFDRKTFGSDPLNNPSEEIQHG